VSLQQRILEIVPYEKEEQWCDKVTVYSRERKGERLCKGIHRIAVPSLVMWSKEKLIAHASQGTAELYGTLAA
jgi:hypothetical protein